MSADRASPSRLVATIGLHASASTWVFNIVRELLVATLGEDQVLSLYADEPAQVPAPVDQHLVIKSHRGSAALDAWLAARAARIFLSIRDPRDACMSMAQRFRSPLAHTVRWIGDDCARVMRLASPELTLLRYEDRFFDDKAVARRIAQDLGIDPAPAVIDAIFARYTTDAVRAFAQSLMQLPAERLTTVVSFPMDRVTQILGPHIGDTHVGKWLDLPVQTQHELTRVFRPFLDRFGYPC